MRLRLVVLLAVAVATSSCTATTSDEESASATNTTAAPGTTAAVAGTIDLQLTDGPGCDPLDERSCLLPFPSDHFTVADPDTDTGRRIAFPDDVLPANVDGKHVDPTEWNRSDGFSPGGPIMLHVPGLDLARTGAAPITDIGLSLAEDAPIVLLDASTGERHPYWVELDAHATSDDDRLLFIRPAVNFLEGHRYIVAIRHLLTGDGAEIPAGDVFRAYRDQLQSSVAEVEQRRPHMDEVLGTLEAAGVSREDLYLAWDFTVASQRGLSERLLHIRDDAYEQLGDSVPGFTVDEVTENVSDEVARRVVGTFSVPLYLTGTGEAGSGYNYGPEGLPEANGMYAANYRCIVPRVAMDGPTPARTIVYGHGLLGAADQVEGFGTLAQTANVVMCATDWIGMSEGDIGNVAAILTDNSLFFTLADRLQQGILNFQFLARLLNDPRGFATAPAFQTAAGVSVIAPNAVSFNGNSQGGILGGAATAISKEWTRAVLGVPAMNYSTLLSRSIDYDPYEELTIPTYPSIVDRYIIQAIDQMLWDRGENNGYAAHMTDNPYPDTPAHTVMLVEAFGDHQVANIATEVMARTIGAKVHQPALGPGRSPYVEPFWGIEAIPSSPYDGSVLVVWDFGTPAPPIENLPPREPDYGEDPHGAGGDEPLVLQQAAAFLAADGAFIDVCDGGPCQSSAS